VGRLQHSGNLYDGMFRQVERSQHTTPANAHPLPAAPSTLPPGGARVSGRPAPCSGARRAWRCTVCLAVLPHLRLRDDAVRQGLPDGRGRVVFANGDRLEGLFRHGHACGACELHTGSGHVFRGDFRAGNKHGFATVVRECVSMCPCVCERETRSEPESSKRVSEEGATGKRHRWERATVVG